MHAIFTKYLELINGHLDGFARSAGYTSAKDVFEAVEAAVEHDKKQREKMMAEMNTMFAQMRLKVQEKEAKAEEKKDDEKKEEDKKDGDKGEKEAEAPASAAKKP